jgi:hypothetical protein
MNKMEKADTMIMLMTLYNRIKDQQGISKVQADNLFNSKVNKLEMDGHITQEDAKFALTYLLPNVRAQEIDKIKDMGAKEERSKIEGELSAKAGYSKSAQVGKINSILESVMKDGGTKANIKAWEPPKQQEIDPCYHGGYSRISRVSSC